MRIVNADFNRAKTDKNYLRWWTVSSNLDATEKVVAEFNVKPELSKMNIKELELYALERLHHNGFCIPVQESDIQVWIDLVLVKSDLIL